MRKDKNLQQRRALLYKISKRAQFIVRMMEYNIADDTKIEEAYRLADGIKRSIAQFRDDTAIIYPHEKPLT